MPAGPPAGPSRAKWLADRARWLAVRAHVVHPFPSLLNGVATTALAMLAGASVPSALRLGIAMTAIQFSIGAVNDLVDAPHDRGRRPVKPLAKGLIAPPAASVLAVVAAVVGLALASASGPATAAVAAAGAACGYAYDLRLSRTVWAWLPLAVALPLVPVFAWVGATGAVPGPLLVLVPIGMLAGGGLAIGNALVDVDVDGAVAAPSIAIRLGRRSATGLHAAALAAAVTLAWFTLPAAVPAKDLVVVAAGIVTLAIGVGGMFLAQTGRAEGVARLAWQVEAVGTAIVGVGWVLALVASGVVAA